MQRIISRAVVATLAAFAILTPTGYAMTDPGFPQAAEKHDAQLQLVDPPAPSPAPDERQVLASRGQGTPVAADKHDAQLQKVVEAPSNPSPIVVTEKHDAQLDKVVKSGTDVVAYGTDVAASDQRASQPAGGSSATVAATTPDDDGGLSTATISALIALVAMTGIAVASFTHRHARVRV
jgi:hypothetical protein